MYRLLIVDDEPLILMGFDHLMPWEEYGIETIYKASSGMEALEVLSCNEVDILITDIKMPDMDGLDLISKVREMNLPINIIVLSGYDDFRFVKQALTFGIDNYLLKPIEEEELGGTLMMIADKREKQQHAEETARRGYRSLRENMLLRLVNGTIGENELTERAQVLGMNLGAEYVLVFRGVPAEEAVSFSEMEDFAELISDESGIWASPGLNGDLIVLFSGNDDKLQADNCMRNLEGLMLKKGINLSFSMGSLQRGWTFAAQSYRDAVNAVDEKEAIPLIESVVDYVKNHISEELALKGLAQRYRVNAAYLGQLFKRSTGELFSMYVNRIRIEKAKEFLLETDLKISEIACMTGYSNTNYFSNQFKQHTGLYPTEYRRTGGKKR